MGTPQYDIFISYKRKSLPTANNLYYRLTQRGYSTFFDLEEMRCDDFNIQLLKYIENAKDIFVIIEEGSLDACKSDDWEKDWFCYEIAYALEQGKHIIPILLGGYPMPNEDFFPEKLKKLSKKNAPDFNFTYFDAYLDRLVAHNDITAKPVLQKNENSVFKFFSDEDSMVFWEGKLVCSIEGKSEIPYYLPVPRKGQFRFKLLNIATKKERMMDESISDCEEKIVDIKWKEEREVDGIQTPESQPAVSKYPKKSLIIAGILLILLLAVLIPLISWHGGGDVVAPPEEASTDETSGSVDLGLPSGTIWATCNLGAKTPYESGDFYMWGSAVPVAGKHFNDNRYFIGQREIASTSYDAATLLLGEEWSLPSSEQMQELIDHCTWGWTSKEGQNGFLLTGPNGKTMFLPVAGCVMLEGHQYVNQFGYYWTGEGTPKNPTSAKELVVGLDQINVESGKQYVGRSIRPVHK